MKKATKLYNTIELTIIFLPLSIILLCLGLYAFHKIDDYTSRMIILTLCLLSGIAFLIISIIGISSFVIFSEQGIIYKERSRARTFSWKDIDLIYSESPHSRISFSITGEFRKIQLLVNKKVVKLIFKYATKEIKNKLEIILANINKDKWINLKNI